MSSQPPRRPAAVDRAALAAVIAGNRPPPPPEELPDWLRAAEPEGVAALLAWRYREAGENTLPPLARETLRSAAARELLADAAERRAVRLLNEARVPFLVLKGAALARWLYAAPYLRPRSDLDLLFPAREVVAHAAAALAPAGYALDADDFPPQPSYETTLRRATGPSAHTVDAHWRMANDGVYFDCLRFDELAAAARPVPGLDGAAGLAPIHALLHACVHRLSSLRAEGDALHWLFDIHLLTCGLDEAAWSRLVSLAVERLVAGPCDSAFVAAAALFTTPIPSEVHAELARAASREPFRMERAQSFRNYMWHSYLRLGSRQRLAFVRRMTFPSFAYMRIQFGVQRHTQLPAAYLRRLLRGLGKYSR